MPFVLAQKPSYRTKVEVDLPNELGTYDSSSFMARFKNVSQDELERLRDKSQLEVLKEVLIGWDDMLDESKNPVPYDEVNRTALLAIPQARIATFFAFWGSIFKAREKN